MPSNTLGPDQMREGHRAVIEDLKSAAEQWIDPNYLHHDPLVPETQTISSRAEYVGGFDAFYEAMPDQRTTANHIIVEGDWSSARWRFEGTNTGEFRGAPPNGKVITFEGLTMYRWENDRIVEGWTMFDVIGFSAQMGLM